MVVPEDLGLDRNRSDLLVATVGDQPRLLPSWIRLVVYGKVILCLSDLIFNYFMLIRLLMRPSPYFDCQGSYSNYWGYSLNQLDPLESLPYSSGVDFEQEGLQNSLPLHSDSSVDFRYHIKQRLESIT